MSDCVLWGGTLSREGYARAWIDGRDVQMHRYLYVEKYGEPPDGRVLHHVCGVKHCVNLDHLLPVTPHEHRQLHLKTHCKQGHPRTPENVYITPTGHIHCRPCHRENNRRNMRRYYREGRSYCR